VKAASRQLSCWNTCTWWAKAPSRWDGTVRDVGNRKSRKSELAQSWNSEIKIFFGSRNSDPTLLPGGRRIEAWPGLNFYLALTSLIKFNFVLKPNPIPIPFVELKNWESSVENEGMFNDRYHKYLLVDRLLLVCIAKSMPVFEKLTLSDQVYTIYMKVYENW